MRSDWPDLPPEVLGAVKAHTGPIHRVEPAPAGNHADITAAVHTADGRLFVKAARKTAPDTDGPEVRSLPWEAAINPRVTEYAPPPLDRGGGRVARPGLRARPGPARRLHPRLTGPGRPRKDHRQPASTPASRRAGTQAHRAPLGIDGRDVRDDNTAHVVDWTFAGRGAAFLEMALLIPWLLKAGHTPAEAERWTSRFPAWTTTAPATIDLFARVSPANGEPTSPPTTRHGHSNTRPWHRGRRHIGAPAALQAGVEPGAQPRHRWCCQQRQHPRSLLRPGDVIRPPADGRRRAIKRERKKGAAPRATARPADQGPRHGAGRTECRLRVRDGWPGCVTLVPVGLDDKRSRA